MNHIIEYSNLGYEPIIYQILEYLSIFSAIIVIIIKNPVISILYLIVLFVCVSCLIIMKGLNFLGLTLILIYVGAISILFLFVIMLLNIKLSELQVDNNNSISIGIMIGIMFLYPIYKYIYDFNNYNDNYNDLLNIINWDNNITSTNQITSIGNIMYTDYSILLIITSLILLLAILSAIVLTLRPNKELININI